MTTNNSDNNQGFYAPQLISSQSASSSSFIEFTDLDSNYPTHLLRMRNVVAGTNNDTLNMYVSVDNGSNYLATSYAWVRLFGSTGGTSGATGALAGTEFQIQGGITNTASKSLSGDIKMNGFNQTTYYFSYWGDLVTYINAGTVVRFCVSGQKVTASAINAIKFQMTTGNISSGEFQLFGLP